MKVKSISVRHIVRILAQMKFTHQIISPQYDYAKEHWVVAGSVSGSKQILAAQSDRTNSVDKAFLFTHKKHNYPGAGNNRYL